MNGNSCLTALDPRLVGDPVDTLTGAVVDRMLDFRLTGPIELRWYRHYDSSQSHCSFSVGNGCAHEYDRSLSLDTDSYIYEEPVGRALRFPRIETDGETCAYHGFTLYRISAQCYRLFGHAQPAMEFSFPAGAKTARLARLLKGEWEVRFHYDHGRRLVGIDDSAGRQITASEDAKGRLTELTVAGIKDEADYRLIAYEYDESGNLIATRNTGGHGYAFTYDDANRMVWRRGRKGFQFYFKYDLEGRCVRAMGNERLYGVAPEYAVPGRLTHVTRPDRGRWSYIFSAAGYLEQIRDPLGGRRRFVRDPAGRIAMEIDENGNASKFVYDEAGAAIAKVSPLGERIALPESLGTSKPPPPRAAANPAEYELGRLLDLRAVVLPDAAVTIQFGLSLDARTLISTRSTAAEASGANKFKVRPLGAPWWPKPARGRIFNALGKLVDQLDDTGRMRHWKYDASGNVTEFYDFDGGRWSYDYATWHLLRGLNTPAGIQIRLSYDTNGNVISFADGGGTMSEYGYDQCGRLIEVHRHGRLRDRYIRDPAGNLVAKHAADGRELLRLEIGPGNRPLKRILASGEEHNFKYDRLGRIVEAWTKKNFVQLAHDEFGRAADKRDGQGVESLFNGSQTPTQTTVLERFVIRYRKRGEHLWITDPTGKIHRIRLSTHGIVERVFANGSSETAQYDGLGRCLFKLVQRTGKSAWRRQFRWSGEGELREIKDNVGGDVHYEYDQAHRLRASVDDGHVEHYVLDNADNLIAQPELFGVVLQEGNRLLEANSCCFYYNDRNHIARREGLGGTVHYRYDSRDQLVSVSSPNSEWEAEYDALGRRTHKKWTDLITTYYWNGEQLAAEIGPEGQLRIYVYADPLALSPLVFIDYDKAGAAPETGCVFNVFADQRGSPCFIENSQGEEVWSARILPFGKAQISHHAKIKFDLRLAGQYCDTETDLHYNRFRYYDPVLGRYIQSDPWGTGGGTNLYAYRTNPLLSADVRGLGEETEDGFNCPEDDEESIWDKTVQHSSDGEEELSPGLQAQIEESQAAYERATILATDLTDEQGGQKTVVVSGDRAFASGTRPTEPFDHVPTDQVMRAHGPDTFPPDYRDQGISGSYNACHGEPQASAMSDAPMGVSNTICDSCHNVLQQKADRTGQPVVVTDPNGTRVYPPRGNGGGDD